MKRSQIFLLLLLGSLQLLAQPARIEGVVRNSSRAVVGATIRWGAHQALSDTAGNFSMEVSPGRHQLLVSSVGFAPFQQQVRVDTGETKQVNIELETEGSTLDAVVVTGTMKLSTRLNSPVAVEVYHPQFFKKNPVPSIFESMQQVNGVRPQINCSICNTGDIHINGLEGPYTMVTIDGMPIVSALSTVYGLFGIPTQLIERVEVVKGPASGLYGSEAVGGLINIITKTPEKAPRFSGQLMTTSWAEHNADLGVRFAAGKQTAILGAHYYRYANPQDANGDGFTDVALQHRFSLFNKWSFARKGQRTASLAARYFFEDRWGGQMEWQPKFAGSDSVYGEAIKTNRWELIGNYQLPTTEKILLQVSATGHQQRSFYGVTPYNGDQRILFGQLIWNKTLGKNHSFLAGLATRYNYYDDNSTATYDTTTKGNRPDQYLLPGIFVQNEWSRNDRQSLLLGLRYDRHPVHGSIFTPRFAIKWNTTDRSVLRLNGGTGFRVVNLFTEEHAALTGARTVEIREALRPEQSMNINLNYAFPLRTGSKAADMEVSAWYSYFRNQILPDYDTDPNKIIYANLPGHAISRGVSANVNINLHQRLKGMVGVTVQDIARLERDAADKLHKTWPVLAERWSGTWTLTYTVPKAGLTFDYTGNVYGKMRLPLAGPADPRPAYSPVWSLQNIQVTKWFSERWEMFGGVKNLLNWTPSRNLPFLIARANDPFDKRVTYNADGAVQRNAENPYGLTFDPSYVYAPNQGIRAFIGVRYVVK
ncbi:TonB-dependent receptor [Paracnuella aquatica]|uniref:TonB-dependent receptor n=1 Tax=Paracnuella aquatica TaxID=2268757 RepID=UPI000DEF37E0|nr:TonB-dependent receptor [Paracnuella aquatica]RPD45138.1 TonB-dependent receptor [Paracnuella aquatica]